MGPYKAPGPDGFQGLFFRRHWTLVRNQVCDMIFSVLDIGPLLEGLNERFLMLIPKVPNPELMT